MQPRLRERIERWLAPLNARREDETNATRSDNEAARIAMLHLLGLSEAVTVELPPAVNHDEE